MKNRQPQNYFSTVNASIYLGISRSTFLRYVRPQIPESNITPFIFCYAKSDLDSYVASRQVAKENAAGQTLVA